MDKNLDFEKLVEQARFLSQLMNSGMNNTREAEADEVSKQDSSYDDGMNCTGEVPIPDAEDNNDIMEKAIQAVKIFQSLNQSEQTSDNAHAYDSTPAQNEFTENIVTGDIVEETDQYIEDIDDAETDFSRIYDETFSNPQIKAIKSAVRFIDSRYHKAIGIWIKFLEMQNMLQIYAKRAESGSSPNDPVDWRRGLLLSVRPHASHEKQYVIDFLIKVIELKDIMSVMEGDEKCRPI